MDAKKNSINPQLTKSDNTIQSNGIIRKYVIMFNKFTYKYRYYIIIIIAIICVLYFCYIYSESYRVKNKLKYITDNLNYTKDKLTLDFCGVDNDVKDIFKSDIKLHLGPNSDENTQKITILNPNIKLRELVLQVNIIYN